MAKKSEYYIELRKNGVHWPANNFVFLKKNVGTLLLTVGSKNRIYFREICPVKEEEQCNDVIAGFFRWKRSTRNEWKLIVWAEFLGAKIWRCGCKLFPVSCSKDFIGVLSREDTFLNPFSLVKIQWKKSVWVLRLLCTRFEVCYFNFNDDVAIPNSMFLA